MGKNEANEMEGLKEEKVKRVDVNRRTDDVFCKYRQYEQG